MSVKTLFTVGRFNIEFIFRWYDLWVGFYWDRKSRILYFFPVPMFGCQMCWLDLERLKAEGKGTKGNGQYIPPGHHIVEDADGERFVRNTPPLTGDEKEKSE